MKNLILVATALLALSSSGWAGRIRMTSPDYSAIQDTLEAYEQYQYEAQLQAQLDAIAARQQYLEDLLSMRTDGGFDEIIEGNSR